MNAVAQEAAPSAGNKVARVKVEAEKVTMQDGRIIAFAGKKKMLKNSFYSKEGYYERTEFLFRDGRILTYAAPAPDLKDAEGILMLHHEAGHGVEQKVGDETAGKTDSISDMYDAAEECIDRLNKGEWFIEGTGVGAFGTNDLITALAEHSGKSVDTLRPWIKGKTKAEKDALRALDPIRAIIRRIEDERATKASHVDTTALFAEMAAIG